MPIGGMNGGKPESFTPTLSGGKAVSELPGVSFLNRNRLNRKVDVMAKIRIVETPESRQVEKKFHNDFLRFTGVEYPPKSDSQWMGILLTAGLSQQECRSFLQYDGYPPLAQQDVSCLEGDGYPTFLQSVMVGLRKDWERRQAEKQEFTPEVRPPSDWRFILKHMNKDEEIPATTWRRWTQGNAPKIRVIVETKYKVRVHLDHFPQNLSSEKMRTEFLKNR